MLTFNANVVSLYYFTDAIINDVKTKLSSIQDKGKLDWATQQFENTKNELAAQRWHLNGLLKTTDLTNPREIRSLVHRWVISLQDLSLQLDPDSLAAPAKNVLKSNYFLSGLLSVVSTVSRDTFSRNENTAPSLFMYTKGVAYDDLARILHYFMFLPHLDTLNFEKDETWDMVAYQKGNVIERIDVGIVNHFMYLRAVLSGDKKKYLVADPFIIGYQELSLDEMRHYVKKYSVH